MKKLLGVFLCAFALVVATPHSIAQDASSASQSPATGKAGKSKKSKADKAGKNSAKAEAELASLTSSLNLTDEQKAKIKPIIDDKHAKMHAVKKETTTQPDTKKAKIKSIRKDSNEQIRALLTPEQQKTFDATVKKGHKKAEQAS
jgi:Spy/CpxP family protein refolding chaperone